MVTVLPAGDAKDPPLLYKYMPLARLSFFENRLVRFTPPEQFNDPFDVAPVVVVREQRPDNAGQTEVLRRGVAGMLERMRDAQQRFVDVLFPTGLTQRIASNSRGILCLSQVHDSLLMWSHYAADHRGFVIALARKHRWLSAAQPVEYTKDRPTVRLGAKTDVPGEAYLYRKSDQWAYEREWRMVRPLVPRGEEFRAHMLDDVSSKRRGRRSAQPPQDLFRIPYGAIAAVIIGARMPKRYRHTLASLLGTRRRLRIGFFEARLSPHRYELDVRPLSRAELGGT